MYRSHLGTLPTNNWQFDSDEETLTHFFKMAVVFQSWDFYRQDLMKEASELGWPVIRHMLMVYPNNSKVYEEELNQQFMVGNELLVAPVLKAGQDKVHVFLPNNTHWRAVWGKEDTLYTGRCEGKSSMSSLSLEIQEHTINLCPSHVDFWLLLHVTHQITSLQCCQNNFSNIL